MSDCRTFEEKFPAYLESSVPEAERREIERHLETCGPCREALQDLKKTGEILADLEEKEAPPWFSQRVMARIREEAEPRGGLIRKLFFPLRVKVPLEVMASLLVAVLAWYVYQASPPEMKGLPESPPAPLLLPQKEAAKAKEAEKETTAAAPSRAREKAVPAPLPAEPAWRAEPAGRGAGEVKKQEEAIPAARAGAPKAPAPEEKTTAAADRMGAAKEAPAPAAPGKKSDPAELKPAPAPVFQAAPRRMERELKEKDESQKLEAFRDQARVVGKASPELLPQVLTLRVREIDLASKTVRELLQRIGAENIREEGLDGKMAVSGVVRPGVLDRLTEQLKTVGEVSRKESPASGSGQSLAVRIEIVPLVP